MCIISLYFIDVFYYLMGRDKNVLEWKMYLFAHFTTGIYFSTKGKKSSSLIFKGFSLTLTLHDKSSFRTAWNVWPYGSNVLSWTPYAPVIWLTTIQISIVLSRHSNIKEVKLKNIFSFFCFLILIKYVVLKEISRF